METFFNVTLIILSVLLMLSVLLQQRGSGLGAGFGGDSAVFTTKRGAEKVLFNITVVIAILFFGLSLARVIVF
ncbi:preprotein translocase subunit SecG [Candidatus Uhrbacteria bacterium]|jgi:preprotein translocase subunit SecG|nr:preprotein translocase subunit SecG [Candidatus Uhrbacteria bacterium]